MASREFLFKILIMGDVNCGKSSLVRRFVHNVFSEDSRPTIGVDFLLKVIKKDDMIIRLQMWDIAGAERFNSMTRAYYRDAVAALVLCDITRASSTLEGAKKWKKDLDSKHHIDGVPIPTLLVCNKIDAVTASYRDDIKNVLEKCVIDEGFNGFLMTSVKNNECIDSAFEFLVKEIMQLKSNLLLGEKDEVKLVDLKEPKNEEPETCYC